jgi:L-lactate utilization protein LutB
METELKRDGKFEEYQRNMNESGLKTYIKEMEDALLEIMLNDNKESFITEAGDIEEWRGGVIDKTKIVEDLQEYIIKLKDALNA